MYRILVLQYNMDTFPVTSSNSSATFILGIVKLICFNITDATFLKTLKYMNMYFLNSYFSTINHKSVSFRFKYVCVHKS